MNGSSSSNPTGSYWMGIYRAVTAIGAVLTPFILLGVLRVYNTLDTYGNRITAVETEQKSTNKDIARLEVNQDLVTKKVDNLNEIYFTELYPRLYGK